jgi:hypothetical protein
VLMAQHVVSDIIDALVKGSMSRRSDDLLNPQSATTCASDGNADDTSIGTLLAVADAWPRDSPTPFLLAASTELMFRATQSY